MEFFLMILGMCVVVKATHKYQPQFRHVREVKPSHIPPTLEAMSCSSQNQTEKQALLEAAKCGALENVFVKLKPLSVHEEVHPGGVWLKRCAGACDHDGEGFECQVDELQMKLIPVRVYNVDTNKERCATYPVAEHLSCNCAGQPSTCPEGPADCVAPRVWHTDHHNINCVCECPNYDGRYACFDQTGWTWNESQCICEPSS